MGSACNGVVTSRPGHSHMGNPPELGWFVGPPHSGMSAASRKRWTIITGLGSPVVVPGRPSEHHDVLPSAQDVHNTTSMLTGQYRGVPRTGLSLSAGCASTPPKTKARRANIFSSRGRPTRVLPAPAVKPIPKSGPPSTQQQPTPGRWIFQ